MAQLRKFQFLRNTELAQPFATYALARTAAETAFSGLGLLDGEIALYSYKLTTTGETVHTLLGIQRDGGIEILGNYDELTAEYQSYVNTQIQALDSEVTSDVTDDSNGVRVTVNQVDGKITAVSVVAPSLSDAIAELDVPTFYLTELNGTTLQRYQISEVDGKIVKGETADTVLTFATAPTAENKVVTQAEITALNANKSGSNATEDITVGVVETAGKITEVTVTDTLKQVAHTGAAADVTVADAGSLIEATTVEGALAELAGDIADLDAAQLSAGNGIDITENKINADFKVTIEKITSGEGESATTDTYIVITGNGENGQEITKVNANAFVKDGFLQKVELIEGTEEGETENVLRFTWNSDAGIQVTNIPVSDLCDVYTAKANDWIQLNGFEFSHKTVTGLESDVAHGQDTDVTVNSTTSTTFKVPFLTVDAAGHVTRLDERTITIALPESIDTAIQTINGHAVNSTFMTTTVTPTNADDNTIQNIEVTATIGDYDDGEAQVNGLATTQATKAYVDSKIQALDDSMTTVDAGAGISVTDAATEGSNDHAYTVALADAPAVVTDNTDDYVAANGEHTRISDITVDKYGRVTAVTKTTVTENFDAGTY